MPLPTITSFFLLTIMPPLIPLDEEIKASVVPELNGVELAKIFSVVGRLDGAAHNFGRCRFLVRSPGSLPSRKRRLGSPPV
ncbi:MAG: hypothetical protein IPK02_10370 [Candidatus Accumulibacter sp.]|uniref:Uncharacterized protein n=1 Tax=Candidatus Accumulibacter affinis TaxID=2954384 RepID=A0A935TAC8_9PROT|nr:hypothetical protein [Candidatus Accumulibacter affinis]